MNKFITFATIIVATILTNAGLVAQPTTPGYEDCPCSALYPGYYYTGQYYPTKPVLYSSMPYDVLVGYIIMDSIITHAKDSFPTWVEQENFIKSLTCTGDTLNYALKHLYRLADYNPFLYYNFLTSYQQGKMQPMSVLSALLDQVKKQCGLPTQEVMKAEYILHLRVNAVENFAYESNNPGDSTKWIYAYAQVLDTIKGQVLPNISTAIEVFEQDSAGTKVKKSKPLNVPLNTDFIFAYNPGWPVKSANGWESTITVKDDREYIAFTYNMRTCVNSQIGHQYYEIRPNALDIYGGIFPIIDGNVKDGANDFGWGTSVPLETFKQNLRALIDSIKNYGEYIKPSNEGNKIKDIIDYNYKLYPNPGERVVTIDFELPKNTENLKITIQDVLGQTRLIPIENGNYEAGEQSILINVDALPVGVYYVIIEAGAYRTAQPLTIVR